MSRRTLIKFLGLFVLGIVSIMSIFSIDSSLLRKLYYRIEDKFRPPVKVPPESQRQVAVLPSEGYTISVETALNSRCTSDRNGNPKKSHWGMFDNEKKLSDDQIEQIIALARMPRFTDRKVDIQRAGNTLTFVIENLPQTILREWLMVESGMQQQAIGLVCAALGVGMVFRNQGKDGTALSEAHHATIKIKVDAMKPTYAGSFWTSLAPVGRRSWRTGTLPDPARSGNKPLISTLQHLQTQNTTGIKSTEKSLGQLLWTARGRTPHLYNSRPWGMTIPTWGGLQDISSVYLIENKQLSKYINANSGRPTSSLELLDKIDADFVQRT